MKRLGCWALVVAVWVASAILSTSPGDATELPFTHLSEAVVLAPQASITCPSGIVLASAILVFKTGAQYGLIVRTGAAPGKPALAVVLDLAEGADTPVWVGYVLADGDTFLPERETTYRLLLRQYPSPCDLLAPTAA